MNLKKNRNFIIGVIFYLIHLIFSFTNDSITKYLINKISGWQILFFRLFFGAIMLFFLILVKDKKYFKTTRIWLHFIRGLLLFFAILTWSYGLKHSLLSQATLIAYIIPFFILILAKFFLEEEITKNLWIATIIGFVGVFITVNPSNDIFQLNSCHFFIIGALLFAMLDVLNKKYISKESMLSMLFYSVFFSSFFTFIPAYKSWTNISLKEASMLFILALNGNLLLYFLLKAFSLANASTLSSFRYIEILLSAIAGWFFFGETINSTLIIGACLIIPSSFYILREKMEN